MNTRIRASKRFLFPRAASASWLALAAFGFQAHAAFDAFLKFSLPAKDAKIPVGESKDQQFPGRDGWLLLDSFDQGILNTVTIGSTSGSGAGKAHFQDFVFTRRTDSASPILFDASAKGLHYGNAELALRQSGTPKGSLQEPFYSALFQQVFINSIHWSENDTLDVPEEVIHSSFGAFEWTYTRFDSHGTPITALTVNWDAVHGTGGDGPLTTELPPTLSYPPAATVASGGSLAIQPTAGPSDSAGIASIVVKSAGGYTGGISVDPLSGVLQLTGAQPVGGPFTITIQVTDSTGQSTDASFALSVNSSFPALIANPDSASRILGRGMKITSATLVANDSAGALFDSLPSANTALGGHVSLSGSTIIYDPPSPDPGSEDSFTYRIHDGFGQSATGTVTIGISGPNGGPSGNLIIRASGVETALRLVGIPGRRYQLQSASSVSGPWMDLGSTVTADANGSAEWVDLAPVGTRFYRAFNTP